MRERRKEKREDSPLPDSLKEEVKAVAVYALWNMHYELFHFVSHGSISNGRTDKSSA